jgi:transcriptional regulator with XRE-family HTH domain
MDLFAKRLRERARRLELSDAEVARRAGLSERRYGHYVRGVREPDFATFMRICRVLEVSPNDLLEDQPPRRPSPHDRWLSRLTSVARTLDTATLKVAVRQVEALLDRKSRDGG